MCIVSKHTICNSFWVAGFTDGQSVMQFIGDFGVESSCITSNL